MKYAVWAVTGVAVFLVGFAVGRIPSKPVPEATLTWATDPAATSEYVNRLAQNMTKYSDAKVPFTIMVLHSDDAVALPGGFFYVNSGLILAPDK